MKILRISFLIPGLIYACESDKATVSYSCNYFSSEKDKMIVVCDFIPNVIPFPHQDNLDSISQYYNSTPFGHLKSYGLIDSVYHYENKNVSLTVTDAIDVGFKKRYSYMMIASAEGVNYKLLTGIKIGGSVSQF